MGALALAMPVREERRSGRVPLSGTFKCQYEDGVQGLATWRSISLDGACIQIGRYLRPGRTMRIAYHGLDLELRVVWCRPAANEEWFTAGVQVVDGGPELALMTLMALVRRLAAQGALR